MQNSEVRYKPVLRNYVHCTSIEVAKSTYAVTYNYALAIGVGMNTCIIIYSLPLSLPWDHPQIWIIHPCLSWSATFTSGYMPLPSYSCYMYCGTYISVLIYKHSGIFSYVQARIRTVESTQWCQITFYV